MNILPRFVLFLFCLAFAPGVVADEKKTAEETLAEMEERVYELGEKEVKKKIKALYKCASYAKSHKMPEEAERFYQEVLSLDPFDPKAHKQLGHVQMFQVWLDKDEYKQFVETLEREKQDPKLKMMKNACFDNNTQIGREAMKKFGQVSQAWAVEIAYRQMDRQADEFYVDICIDIFASWAGDRARDVWLKKIARRKSLGGMLKMLGHLKSSMSDDLENPATKFVLKQVLSKHNENVSLKCLELLEQVDNPELDKILQKFMNRCNNQNVKQKIMQMLF